MKEIFKNIKGDKGIWAAFFLLAFISFLPMYSATTNLVNVIGKGTTSGYFFKHTFIIISGFIFLYILHKTPYRYFSGASVVLMPIAFGLLIYTMTRGTTIAGAFAARWIEVPFIGVSIQTSTFAGLVLMMYVARYFSRRKDTEFEFKHSFWFLWVPVGLILMPILPSNFSTTALLLLSVIIMSLLVGYPIKFLLKILGIALVAFTLFVFVGRSLSHQIEVKTDTWKNRILVLEDVDATYQIEKAKMAIATGGMFGKGAGKSIQKNFLPQSSNDFIFAIIIEEWGLFGGLFVITLFAWLLFRTWVVAKRAKTIFATLLVIGVGFPIIIQAIINMLVATNSMFITGQTLPLLSSGGTSIWMTCAAIGMVLSVSVATQEGDKIEKLNDENPLDILYEAVD